VLTVSDSDITVVVVVARPRNYSGCCHWKARVEHQQLSHCVVLLANLQCRAECRAGCSGPMLGCLVSSP